MEAVKLELGEISGKYAKAEFNLKENLNE